MNAAVRDRLSCPQAPGLDRSPWRAWIKDRALHMLIPPARALVRFGPAGPRRDRLWNEKIEPYLAWHSHHFASRTRFGARLRGDTQEVLQQHIYYFGIWEPNLTRWLQDRLRPGDTFVDVGANIGYFTLLASRLVGERGSVIAVEASPQIHRRLNANLRRNRVTNVRAVNAAAAALAEERGVHLGPASHTGLTTLDPDAGWPLEAIVPGLPLHEITGPEAWRQSRLIKVDVEGAEDEVVNGFADQLQHASQELELVIELHPGSNRQLLRRLAAVGFHAYALEIDYSPLAYGSEQLPVARRLEGVPDRELDLVFSRRDAQTI